MIQYDKKNRFVYLMVNEDRVKLYDNDKLTVFDAALAYGLSNEDIFPKRGKDIHYTINGKPKFVRGQSGEAAVIKLNGEETGLNQKIKAGDQIKVVASTKGEDAHILLQDVIHSDDKISILVNDVTVLCPQFVTVNGSLQSEFYEIQDGDRVELLNYYTLSQLMRFMDIETPHEVFVNGARAVADTKIYDNFSVAWIDRKEIYLPDKFVTEEAVAEVTDDITEEKQTDNKTTSSDLEEGPAKSDLVNQWIKQNETKAQ